jgi:hypothetical protein
MLDIPWFIIKYNGEYEKNNESLFKYNEYFELYLKEDNLIEPIISGSLTEEQIKDIEEYFIMDEECGFTCRYKFSKENISYINSLESAIKFIGIEKVNEIYEVYLPEDVEKMNKNEMEWLIYKLGEYFYVEVRIPA